MQAKDKELAAMVELRGRHESELQQLQADLDSSRAELLRVTGGDYGLTNALDELRALGAQLQHLKQARDALVTEVRTVLRACGGALAKEPQHCFWLVEGSVRGGFRRW